MTNPPPKQPRLQLPKWDSGETVERIQSDNALIEVRQKGNYRWLHFGDPAVQSIVDLSNPGKPLHTYSHSMLVSLCFDVPVKSVLSLGLGGGSLERFFNASLPHIETLSVEESSVVIKLAQRYFLLPDSCRVIEQKAELFVHQCNAKFDLIFSDLFIGLQHGLCPTKQSYYRDLSLLLSNDGILILNLIPTDSDQLLKTICAITPHFKELWLIDHPNNRNIVILCRNHSDTVLPNVMNNAFELSRQLKVDIYDSAQHLLQVPV